jgi:hypothetical protein
VLLEGGRDADRHSLVDASEPVRAASPVSKTRGSQSVLHWASRKSASEMGSTAQASLTAAEAEDSIRHKSTRVSVVLPPLELLAFAVCTVMLLQVCWDISRQEVDLRKQAALLASYSDAFRKIQVDHVRRLCCPAVLLLARGLAE